MVSPVSMEGVGYMETGDTTGVAQGRGAVLGLGERVGVRRESCVWFAQ